MAATGTTLLHSTPVYSTLLGSDWQRCDSTEERVDAGLHKDPEESTHWELATHFREMFDLLDEILKCKRHLYSLLYKDPICILKKKYYKYNY